METNLTQLPTLAESGVESEVELPATEIREIFSAQSEELSNAPEVLQEIIKEINDSSQALVESVVADPLDNIAVEQGVRLGLSQEEIAHVLTLGEYSKKDASLRATAQILQQSLLARIAQAAQVSIAALAIGTSTPALAESDVTAKEVTLQMTQTLKEEKMPRTREEAYARLKESVLAPIEKAGLFVRKDGDESFAPTIFKRGASNTVPLTGDDNAKISEAMASNTSDIELVHTHPINEVTESLGGLSAHDKEIVREGGIPRVTMNPSTTDLRAFAAKFSKYPPAQISGRVIDPSGEWEYGVADSSAPFIAGLRHAYQEMDAMNGGVGFTPEERAYLKKLNIENIHPDLLQSEISSRVGSDPLGQAVLQKMNMAVSNIDEIMGKNISHADGSKFIQLEGGWFPWMKPGTPEGDAEIAWRERTASELGFRMKYTPNPIAPKIETGDHYNTVDLQMSDMIDPANFQTTEDQFPVNSADEFQMSVAEDPNLEAEKAD